MHIRMTAKIWERRDPHSPRFLPPTRSVEKRAWERGCQLYCISNMSLKHDAEVHVSDCSDIDVPICTFVLFSVY